MTKLVFGVGMTLYNNWKYISKYYNPHLAVDNDPAKWGQFDSTTGLKCISPNEILNYDDPEILVTVGDPYAAESIKRQLGKLSVDYIGLIEKIEEWSGREQFPIVIKKQDSKIWLVNTPEHDNLGDHLIAISELELIKKLMPDKEIVEITDVEYLWHKIKLKKYISEEDLIIITGGGFMGSLWLYNAENTIREIITDYPSNRIIIFPQTVFFESNDRGKKEYKKSSQVYKGHKDLTICLREKKSYEILKEMLNIESNIFLLPDMGLLYKRRKTFKRNNNLITFCFRSDKESVINEDEKNRIIQIAKEVGEIKFISMHSGKAIEKKHRDKQVSKKMEEIATSSLIITDTLHCMVFSALSGTPCIAIDNLSNKVSNVYEWIKDLEYIKLCNDLSQMKTLINGIKNKTGEFYLPHIEEYENTIKTMLIK